MPHSMGMGIPESVILTQDSFAGLTSLLHAGTATCVYVEYYVKSRDRHCPQFWQGINVMMPLVGN